jgi:hypothetical protein
VFGEEGEAAKEGGGGGRLKQKQLMPDEGGDKYVFGDDDDDDAAADDDVAECNFFEAACEAAAIALAKLLLPAKQSQNLNSTIKNIGCSKCSKLAYTLVANNHNARIMTGRGGGVKFRVAFEY